MHYCHSMNKCMLYFLASRNRGADLAPQEGGDLIKPIPSRSAVTPASVSAVSAPCGGAEASEATTDLKSLGIAAVEPVPKTIEEPKKGGEMSAYAATVSRSTVESAMVVVEVGSVNADMKESQEYEESPQRQPMSSPPQEHGPLPQNECFEDFDGLEEKPFRRTSASPKSEDPHSTSFYQGTPSLIMNSENISGTEIKVQPEAAISQVSCISSSVRLWKKSGLTGACVNDWSKVAKVIKIL